MQAYVYTDKSLARYAGRFVWLSLNTENSANAKFLERYPIPALPTILVLDAKRDTVTSRYVGGANVAQIRKLLDDAEKTYRVKGQSAADSLLAKADRLAAEGKNAEAAKAFEEAMANAPLKWSGYGRATESLLFSLTMNGDHERCATRALEIYPRVKGTPSAANVSAIGLSCAASLEETHAKRLSLVGELEKAAREVFKDARILMSDDDRSGMYLALIEARDAVKDEEGGKKLKAEWAAFLEDAAARAKTPEQRTVFDSHRVSAYLEVGTPEKAIPMLEQSERDFPDDYNPPARLAGIYKVLKQYDKALAASDRAMARVYGPRKLIVMNARAELFVAMDDKKAARETLQQAIEYAKALPAGQRSERRIAMLEKRLGELQ
ncbi:MAG TPA: tetratricopeptide repeat protein [Thermoanaerobaculia bacterium]|jgi:tetratricopeptide (TPR) repeat protein